MPSSRLHEKEELQKLNDRFSNYVARIRQLLGQPSNNVDTSAFLKSMKVLDEEIANLKSIYESELDKLRKEIEDSSSEQSSLHAQCNKQQEYIGELQERLATETRSKGKLLDEISALQKKIGSLEEEVQDLRTAAKQPQESLNQLERQIDNLTREANQWRQRYEHEQLANQKADVQLQQIMKKAELSDNVHNQQIKDYQSRLDLAGTTILNLEARIQELTASEVSVTELQKQVQEKMNMELRNHQAELEAKYNRNLSALKVQIDSDAETLQRLRQEKAELTRSMEELQTKVRSLEGQVANLQHQNRALEDTVAAERRQGADNIWQLEKKLRDLQSNLVTMMHDAAGEHHADALLKAEIEAFKALLDEEEKRLQMPLQIVSPLMTQSMISQPPAITSFSKILHDPHQSHSTTSLANSSDKMLASVGKTDVLHLAATSSQPLGMASVPGTAFVTTDYNYNSCQSLVSGPISSYPCDPSPPLSPFYIPEALKSTEDEALSYETSPSAELSAVDLHKAGILLPMTGPQYQFKSSSSDLSHGDTSSPLTSRPVGPIHSRTKSAPSKTAQTEESRCNTVTSDDCCEEKLQDHLKNTVISKSRPTSSPLERMPLSLYDNSVISSSAIGDLKIQEINEDGKFIRLLNDGPTEFDLGGYMIQQIVGGQPVAVFRFPSGSKFPSDSTVTVWSAINDPKLHNPPTDFFWKEKLKWGTGPECTTLLCRASGQAVAWMTPNHRFTKDVFHDSSDQKQDSLEMNEYSKKSGRKIKDSEALTELKADLGGLRAEPVYLLREKQQPPSLTTLKHPHGSSPAAVIHPHTGQQRPYLLGNDNSTYSRQSRTQTARPDPIPGYPYTGAPAQRILGTPLKRGRSGKRTQPPAVRENTTLTANSGTDAGGTTEPPSPFMRPRNRFNTGLEQIRSQHRSDFNPPMLPLPLTPW